MPQGSPFKAGTRRLKKGYRFAKGGRVVKARSTSTWRKRPSTSKRRKSTARRKSSCVAFRLPPRGRGGRFVRRGRRRR